MEEFIHKYNTLLGKWVVSTSDHLFWETGEDLEYRAFRTLSAAVRDIQSRECSPKKSLQTINYKKDHRLYICRDCDGHLAEYSIYRITEETRELLMSILEE